MADSEPARAIGSSRHLAALTGLLLFSGDLQLTASGRGSVVCRAEVAGHLKRLGLRITNQRQVRPGRAEVAFLLDPTLVGRAGLLDPRGNLVQGLPARVMLADSDIAAAVVRSAFVASDVVTDGRGQGWFIPCGRSVRAVALVGLLRRVGIPSQVRERRAVEGVKVTEQGRRGLAQLGLCDPNAPVSGLGGSGADGRSAHEVAALIAINIERRGVQRDRTSAALDLLGERCPPHLREAAALRLQHPSESLEELGKRFDPPLTRHAVCGRLRRLASTAESLAES